MIEIRYVCLEDKEFWFSLDKHLSEQEFNNKVRDNRGYVLLDDNKPIEVECHFCDKKYVFEVEELKEMIK